MQATVNKISQSTTIGTTGRAQHVYHVSFNVGDHGPFLLTVPEAQFNAEHISAEMQKVRDIVLKVHQPGQA